MRKGPRPRVLVVDDDPGIRSALDRGLGRAGYEVYLAPDGETAIAMALVDRPDIILLDIVMPGGPDGYEVCKQVHEHAELGFIPVVFITSMDREEDEATAFAAGAAGYLRKPFEIQDLLEQMEIHLEKSRKWEQLEDPSVRWSQWVAPGTFGAFKAFIVKERRTQADRKTEVDALPPEKLFELGLLLNMPEEQVARYAAKFLDLSYVQRIHSDDVAVGVLPKAFCERNLVVPVRGVGDHVGIVMANPFRWDLLDTLNRTVWRHDSPDVSLTAPDNILRLFEDVTESILKVPTVEEAAAKAWSGLGEDGEHPVLHLANELLGAAVAERASDIHIEPKDRHTLVRFRIDGDMQDIRTLDSEHASRLISRYKALAAMDIAERRKPQDGSVEVHVGHVRLKLRLATSSTSDGETLIVRLLEPTKSSQPLEQLGMTPEQVDVVTEMVGRHQGMVLIVGPTGSGKSTTIFSLLSRVDGRTRSIMSVEDPVEYRIPFANQQQVNERAGVTFEALLKSAMRQDPDVLFLGEIRDTFSAKASLDFASSGHLTVSTLHAANATTAIFRLERLGIQRAGMADSILGVVAQRLIKKLCHGCRDIGPITAEERELLENFTDDIPATVARPRGCPACRETGYQGREAVYEVLRFDGTLSEMVRSGASINQIRAHTIERGDFMIFDHVLHKVRQQVCSPMDAYEGVLLEEARFRQATDARVALGLEQITTGGAMPPRAVQATQALPEPLPTVPDPTEEEKPGSASVLLVEDDVVTSKVVSSILEAGGYAVTTADDGVDALLAIGQQSFDAIVSDINMPNLGGLPLLEMLVTKGVDTPVLFISVDSSPELEAKVLEAGAEDFIRKPIKAEVLTGRIGRAIRRRKMRATA